MATKVNMLCNLQIKKRSRVINEQMFKYSIL